MNTSKKILNGIIREKAKGDTFLESNVQMKMMMKGINVKGIMEDKIPDTPDLIEKLHEIAKELEVDIHQIPTT